MDKLNGLLENWRTTKNIENVLNSGFSFDPESVQDYLKTVSADNREKVIAELNEMMDALKAHIIEIQNQQSDVAAQIDKNLVSAKACISYGTADMLGKKDK